MSWAWRQDTRSSGERLVLLAIADHSGAEGVCWPSVAAISEKTRLGDSTVRGHIDRLVERGVLVKLERRRRKDGTLGSWTYRLAFDAPETTADTPAVVDPPSTADTPAVDHRRHTGALEPSLPEPSIECERQPCLELVGGTDAIDVSFEAFWRLYPRRQGKADAQKAWAKLDHLAQIAAVTRLPDHVSYWQSAWPDGNTRYIPHPATWLNRHSWQDELKTAPRPGSNARRSRVTAVAAAMRSRGELT